MPKRKPRRGGQKQEPDSMFGTASSLFVKFGPDVARAAYDWWQSRQSEDDSQTNRASRDSSEEEEARRRREEEQNKLIELVLELEKERRTNREETERQLREGQERIARTEAEVQERLKRRMRDLEEGQKKLEEAKRKMERERQTICEETNRHVEEAQERIGKMEAEASEKLQRKVMELGDEQKKLEEAKREMDRERKVNCEEVYLHGRKEQERIKRMEENLERKFKELREEQQKLEDAKIEMERERKVIREEACSRMREAQERIEKLEAESNDKLQRKFRELREEQRKRDDAKKELQVSEKSTDRHIRAEQQYRTRMEAEAAKRLEGKTNELAATEDVLSHSSLEAGKAKSQARSDKDIAKHLVTLAEGEASEMPRAGGPTSRTENSGPRDSSPTFCQQHWSEKGCKKRVCYGLHLCKLFLAEICKSGDQCIYGHAVDSYHNKMAFLRIQKDVPVEQQTVDDLRRLFAKKRIVSDQFYHSHLEICLRQDSKAACQNCCRVHICRKYVEGSCSRQSSCKIGHSLHTARNREVFQRHRVDKMNDHDILTILRDNLAA